MIIMLNTTLDRVIEEHFSCLHTKNRPSYANILDSLASGSYARYDRPACEAAVTCTRPSGPPRTERTSDYARSEAGLA